MKQTLTILLGLVMAFAAGGCKSMHDGPRHLESNPTGAKVTVLRLNLEFTTPVELPDEEPLRNECQHFLDCVKNHKQPLTDARSALDVLNVLQACETSLQQGGKPTPITSE